VCAMTPGPKPSSGTAMTHAERQSSSACSVARYRAKQAGRTPRSVTANHHAVAELQALQSEYQAWLDAMPENMADSGTAEALRAICDLDLSELESFFRTGGLVATELLRDVKRNQVVAKWNIDGRTLVIINRRIG
jgi:hypothetical protein